LGSSRNVKVIKEKKRKIILNTITGIFSDEYKKKNGTWNISKLVKDLKMSKNTIKNISKN